MNTSQEQIRRMNEALRNDPDIQSMLRRIMPRSPRYRYYSRTGSLDRYFYTVEKINHKGRPRYVAGIYRHLKTKKQWKLVKKVGFARKYKADAWALAMRDREQSKKIPTQ